MDWKSIIISIVMLVIGLWMIISKFRADRHARKTCTEQVVATCTRVDEELRTSGNTGIKKIYTPHYSYEYQGKQYTVRSTMSESSAVPKEGAGVYLYINPENPEQFERRAGSGGQVMYVVGGIFALFGIMGLYSALFPQPVEDTVIPAMLLQMLQR